MSLEEIDHILKTARSVRRRLDFDRPVPEQEILSAIDVAAQAPIGMGGENWRFLVVTDPDLKRHIANHYTEVLEALLKARQVPMKPTHRSLVDNLHRVPCLVFVYAIGEAGGELPGQLAYFGSILPAAWSLMLALRARGLGATWTTLLAVRASEISELLNVPPGVTQTVMLPVGYTKGAVLKPADRVPAEQLTFWNGWGQVRESDEDSPLS